MAHLTTSRTNADLVVQRVDTEAAPEWNVVVYVGDSWGSLYLSTDEALQLAAHLTAAATPAERTSS